MKPNDIMERALAALDKLRTDPRVIHAEITGSMRRGKAEVGDLDLLIVTHDPTAFLGDELPEGTFKADARPWSRENVADVFVATPDTYGATLVFSTGPRLINRKLRERAAQRQLLYDFRSPAYGNFEDVFAQHGSFIGLYRLDGQLVPTPTEEAFFKLLDVPYVPPPHREWLAERL